jgi:hypothetical protein
MAFAILGVATGTLCALLYYRVFMMLPVSALLIAAGLGSIILHAPPWIIAVEVLGSLTASQFAYVAVSLAVHLVRSRAMIPHAHMVN